VAKVNNILARLPELVMFTALATNMWLTSTFDRLFGGGVGSKGSWILGAVPVATGPMWRMRNICITVSYAVQAMANTCFYCICVCMCVWGEETEVEIRSCRRKGKKNGISYG